MTNNLDIKSTPVNGLKVSKQCSLSPDKDSDVSKTFTIELVIDQVTVGDMANGLLKSEVIRWQNNNRKNYDKLVNRSKHTITFKRPLDQISPEEAMIAKLQAMSPEARLAYLQELANKVAPTTPTITTS